MPTKEAQGYTYKVLLNGEWQDVTIAESPIELVEKFEQSEEWARVVRCRDCIHYYADPWGYGNCVFEGGVSRRTKESDFCSWGEREEVETGNTYSIGKIELPKGVFRQIYDEERREDGNT